MSRTRVAALGVLLALSWLAAVLAVAVAPRYAAAPPPAPATGQPAHVLELDLPIGGGQ